MTQNEKIIKALDESGEITALQAMHMGIMRLASRINELRRDGVDIVSEMRTVTCADGSKARIAVYRRA